MLALFTALLLTFAPTSAEVDTWPIGSGVEVVTNTIAPTIDAIGDYSVLYYTGYADEAAQDNFFSVQDPTGAWHFGCSVEVDEPASHMICDDGFHEDS